MGIKVDDISFLYERGTAMQVTAVYACVRVIAETIASLPFGVFQETPEGSIKALEHPLYRGHTDYQTTANVYTHIKEEMLKKAIVDLDGVFKKRAGAE